MLLANPSVSSKQTKYHPVSTCQQCQPRRAAPITGGVEVSTAENTSWDDPELTPEHYEVSDRIP